MPEPRRRDRSKASKDRQLRPSLAETRDLAEAAKRAAEEATKALEENRALFLSIHKKKSGKRESPSRFLALITALLACIFLIAIMSILVSVAFTSPPPNLTDLGAAGVFIGQAGLDQKQRSLLGGEGITLTTYLAQGDSHVIYEIGFPKEFAGRRFVLVLTGSAALEGAKYSNDYAQCPASIAGEVADCQLVSGKVPVPSDEHTIVGADYCFPWQKDVEVITVRFSGRAQIDSSPDWAHHITSLPYLGNQAEIGGVSDLGGAYLGPAFTRAELSGCQALTRNPEWTDPTPSWPPSLDKGDVMIWRPDDNGATLTVVSTERSAAWKGNMLLALIGIAGGGLITLVIATYRSGMSLRDDVPS